MQSARSPSLLARACGLKMAVAVKSSGSFLALRSARLLATSRSLPGRRPYRHGPASQDEFRSRELRQPCMALRSARPLAKARSLPGSPSLPARALCRFYMLTRTGRASTGSLPRAVPEPPPPRLAAVIQEGVADLRVHPLDIPRPAVSGHSLQHPRITLPRQHMPTQLAAPRPQPSLPQAIILVGGADLATTPSASLASLWSSKEALRPRVHPLDVPRPRGTRAHHTASPHT
jgi:hypothetical protein